MNKSDFTLATNSEVKNFLDIYGGMDVDVDLIDAQISIVKNLEFVGSGGSNPDAKEPFEIDAFDVFYCERWINSYDSYYGDDFYEDHDGVNLSNCMDNRVHVLSCLTEDTNDGFYKHTLSISKFYIEKFKKNQEAGLYD